MIYDDMRTPRPEVPLRRKTSKDARRDAREGRNTGPKSLYADADLRVFESPQSSQDKWEEAGLIVVQVREGALGKG